MRLYRVECLTEDGRERVYEVYGVSADHKQMLLLIRRTNDRCVRIEKILHVRALSDRPRVLRQLPH